jgi:2-polyprenyl-6-methoxyphenol hydroxylase-like FAD-dependent oxidoreductase
MVATRLAQLDWSVRVHERASDLRMFGAGIWLWENGLRSLEAAGALESATARAQVMKEWRIADEVGETLYSRSFSTADRLLIPPRADLYESLICRAQEAGVDIVTNSVVVGARPEGILELENGDNLSADLVVAADGAFSRTRESVFCTGSIEYSDDSGIRMLIERTPGYPDDIVTEYWNGRSRLLYNPCTAGEDYVFVGAPVSDERARQIPINRELWRSRFPVMSDVIDRFVEAGRWDRLLTVRCRSWSLGKVVVVGDAAHAMEPNLGQAANMAFTNALSLARCVTRTRDIPSALQDWERQERPLTDHVQRLSRYYGFVVSRWPDALLTLRRDVLRVLGLSEWFDETFNRGARHDPCEPTERINLQKRPGLLDK